MPRPPKKRPISITVYEGCDANGEPTGIWHGYLPIKDATGKVIRRAHREARSKDECEDKIRELEDELAAEAARRAANIRPEGKVMRVHAWLKYWLHEIKQPKVSYNMFRDYEKTITLDILPNLDDDDLPSLEAKAIETMLKRIRRKHPGSTDKPNRAYRHLRMALNAAAARPKETGLWQNPILAVDMPEHTSPEATPFSVEQTKSILAAAKRRDRCSARWTCAWAFGMRPGEALALMRDDFALMYRDGTPVPVDLWHSANLEEVVGVLRIKENLYRRKWQHGCADPHACGAKYHRYPCPQRGAKHDRYHRRGCPKVAKFCDPGCTEHAAQCGSGHGGIAADGTRMPAGQVRKKPKSKAGTRTLVLPRGATAELLAHLLEQDAEKEAAGEYWIGSGALFATKRGGVINERDDYGEFLEILAIAGLEHQRPYDGRHGAATMLLAKKVHKRYVMDALGWSSERMLLRYQHVLDEMRAEVGEAIGSLLFDDAGSATDHATAKVTDLGEWKRKRV